MSDYTPTTEEVKVVWSSQTNMPRYEAQFLSRGDWITDQYFDTQDMAIQWASTQLRISGHSTQWRVIEL